MIKEKELQKKWWWRLMQIVYGLTYFIFLIVVADDINSGFQNGVLSYILGVTVIEALKTIILYIIGIKINRGVLSWFLNNKKDTE